MERAQLSAARYKRHWSLEEAAEHLNVDKATLQRWEKGKSAPQAINLRRLCEVYVFLTREEPSQFNSVLPSKNTDRLSAKTPEDPGGEESDER